MAAAWKEELVAASFRGVPFRVSGSQRAGGRKNVVHEYPGRDDAFVEDLGRRARSFSVQAFVIGGDYMTQRRALEDALEASGPGQLVHPYHGSRLVAVSGDFSVDESNDEGGVAKFTITFVETADAAFSPSIAKSPLSGTKASAATARTAVGNNLLRSHSIRLPLNGGITLVPGAASKALPGFTFTSLTTLVQNASTSLRTAMRPAISSSQNLSSLKRQIDNLVLDASSLVRQPALLVTQWRTLLSNLREWPTTSRLGVAALLAAYAFISTAKRPTATTATREREQLNYDATDQFLRRSIIIDAAEAAATTADVSARTTGRRRPSITTATSRAELVQLTPIGSTSDSEAAAAAGIPVDGFDSYEDAVAVRDVIVAAIDEQLVTADDEAYAALVQLRADVALSVPGEGHPLPRLVTHTPLITVPALVASYRLYGDLALTDDIVARNRIQHPGFVQGGRPLQVLANV